MQRIGIGADAHNLLRQRSYDEAVQPIDERELVAQAAAAQDAVRRRFKADELRAQAIAARRRQLEAQGWTAADLDELAKNTVVEPPPGMMEAMQEATQAVFGNRKRGYSEPLKRPYKAVGKKFEGNVLEEVADKHGVSLRMVTACLIEYRAFMRNLGELAPPNPDGDG